jgi:flagellar P-ring protein precursor FlgI
MVLRCAILSLLVLTAISGASKAGPRLGDLVEIDSEGTLQSIGFGIVVGLEGRGDDAALNPMATQLLDHARKRIGLTDSATPPSAHMAAVLVIADIPKLPGGRSTYDLRVYALGNARSIEGGELLSTPLSSPDGKPVAEAHGRIEATKEGKNRGATLGRIPLGATIDKGWAIAQSPPRLSFVLKRPNPQRAQAIADAINTVIGEPAARAQSAALVTLDLPDAFRPHIRPLLSVIGDLDIRETVTTTRVTRKPETLARQILPDAMRRHINNVFATNVR